MWIAVVLCAAGAGFAVRGFLASLSPVTLTSLAPDNARRIVLVERLTGIDRQFDVRLEDFGSGQGRTVFRSPDEGLPVGSERVVWSVDGSRFLLLGRHFFITDAGRLPAGEQAYLMMDMRSGQVWCNSRQQSAHAGFGLGDLRSVKWLGWAADAYPGAAADRGR